MNKCPQCAKRFDSVAKHWRWKPDHRPSLTDEQRDVVIGSLMGDGCIANHHHETYNPNLVVQMVTEEYLDRLDEAFGIFSGGVRFQASSEDQKRYFEDYFGRSAECQDIYRFRTCPHPDFEEFNSWYSGEKKQWPEDIELTPTVLKHWYCGDGSLSESRTLFIGMSNEVGNEEKVESYFREVGLPLPNAWHTQERNIGNRSGENHYARWNVEETKELLEYMGSPPPGFEYKWI